MTTIDVTSSRRFFSAELAEPFRVILDGVRGGNHVGDAAAVLGVGRRDERVRVTLDHLLVLERYAEHRRNHLAREAGGNVGDEVALAVCGDVLDDLRGLLGDVLLELGDHPGREPLVHDQPVLGVDRRIHVDDRRADRVVEDPDGRHARVRVVVAADAEHVAVAHERPEAGARRQSGRGELLVEADRPFPAQQFEDAVDVVAQKGVGVAELDLVERKIGARGGGHHWLSLPHRRSPRARRARAEKASSQPAIKSDGQCTPSVICVVPTRAT